jgi:hypothetical protein
MIHTHSLLGALQGRRSARGRLLTNPELRSGPRSPAEILSRRCDMFLSQTKRHHSKTIARIPVCRDLTSNRDSDEIDGIVVGDARSAAPTKVGPSTSGRDRGNPSTSQSVDKRLSDFSAPLNDHLRAIRRKLWIFNATLDSLPTTIEMAYQQSAECVEREMLDRSVHTCDGLANEGFALKGKKILESWPARWKRARLRARAVRAERHAAVAMNNASDSLGHAFEAVQQYARARAEADESCRNIIRTSASRDCN